MGAKSIQYLKKITSYQQKDEKQNFQFNLNMNLNKFN